MSHRLAFRVVPKSYGGGSAWSVVVPVIDGRSLVDRVAAFERKKKFKPSGGYAGFDTELVRNVFARDEFGPYRGSEVELLSCDGCGQAGCWPLEAEILVADRTVIWQDFRQPHRPNRRYTGFGPFVFERVAYDTAIAAVRRQLTLG